VDVAKTTDISKKEAAAQAASFLHEHNKTPIFNYQLTVNNQNLYG